MNDEISFGRIVKEYRRALDLTQAELARRVACATITIRKIEADALRPSQQIAERLAMALAIPLEERAAFAHLARSASLADQSPPSLPTPSPTPEEIGREDLSGRAIRGYELGERIGTGGFGVVYRAVQPLVEREVAIKIVLPQYADHPEFIRRFEAEAQLVARLEHPYVVPLYDYWREPGVAYLVMRLLRGGSLQARLKGGPLALDAVASLLEQIGAALHAAHRAGVVHRDLKPANVLLDEDGNGYLADFGIAKNLNLEDQTQAGAILGSPAYLSPEQILSEPVRPQADIYCLGILLYELLTGQKPFRGPTPVEYIQQHLSQPLPSLAACQPGLPPALEAVIGRATAKNPLERYPDVPGLLADFRQALAPMVTIAQLPYPAAVPDEEVENPYKGLRAFGEADADDFFGRETLVQELLGRLAEAGDPITGAGQELARFLAVVGPSGGGKSSAVKAGLIPALRRGGLPGSEKWFIVDMLPGAHPWEELEAALLRVAVNPPPSLLAQLRQDERGLLRAVRRVLPADEATELVLVLDQFEEIFTLVEDEAERARFLDSLVTAVLDPRSRLRLVITMRADFIHRALEYIDFGELLRQRAEFVLPLTPDELELAIARPAEHVGLVLEPGLVASIMRDVGEQPGTLPLLQYALTELFERRQGRLLSLAAYQASGGVSGALARRAEELYASLETAGQEAARQLFLRLVTPGEGGEDTRRRVLRAELEGLTDGRGTTIATSGHLANDNRPTTADSHSGPPGRRQPTDGGNGYERTTVVGRPSAVGGPFSAMDQVIDLYGRYRLLTFDHDPVTRGPTVEVAHEALLRAWGRLREWLEAGRADVRLQRLLAAGAREWLAAGRDPSFLLRGTRLTQFESWAASSAVALTADERAYLEASLADRQARRAQARRAQTVLRALRAFLGVAAVIAFALAILAFNARATAQHERDKAQREADVNHSLVLADSAQRAYENGESDLALALALEAVAMDQPPPEAQRALTTVAYGRGTRAILQEHGNAIKSLAFSPDGQTALSASCGRLDAQNHCTQGEVILWDLKAGAELRRLQGHSDWVNGVAFSPDTLAVRGTGGETALSASADGTLILWDVTTGSIIRRFEGHTSGVNGVAFSSDGQTALSGSDDGSLFLWDVASGEIIRRFEGHTKGVTRVAFSPDTPEGTSGTTALSGSYDNSLILWDVGTGQAIRRLEGHVDWITGLAFHPNGRTALSTSYDMTLRQWDLETGQELRQQFFPANADAVALSPDGRLAVFDWMQEVRLWDIGKWREAGRLLGHTSNDVWAIAVSPDGRLALSGADDGELRLWNLAEQGELRRLPTDGTPLWAVAVSHDGRRLLVSDSSGNTLVYDVRNGQLVQRLPGDIPVSPNALAFSPDDRTALVGSGDFFTGALATSLVLWDLASGQPVHRFEGHTQMVRSLAFSPDGRSALAGSQTTDINLGGDLILWDMQTGQLIRRFDDTDDIAGIAFSADGRRAVTGSVYGSNVSIWDVASGRAMRRFESHEGFVLAVAFGPGEQTILYASGNGALVLLDAETGQVLRRYLGHDNAAWGLDVSPDGRYAISGSEDSTVILWDFETGELLRRFTGHTGWVSDVAFSRDGQTAFSVSDDGSLIQWQVADPPLEELIAWVHANRYVRDLTCEERARYRVEPLCEAEGATPTSE
jgi:WD40 repeat protein/transcriptional regulator with XRE-family HTH domain